MAENTDEIRISNVPKTVKGDLKNIAKNHGVDLGQFLKVKLIEIRNLYPEEMRKAKRD